MVLTEAWIIDVHVHEYLYLVATPAMVEHELTLKLSKNFSEFLLFSKSSFLQPVELSPVERGIVIYMHVHI